MKRPPKEKDWLIEFQLLARRHPWDKPEIVPEATWYDYGNDLFRSNKFYTLINCIKCLRRAVTAYGALKFNWRIRNTRTEEIIPSDALGL